MSDLFFIVGGRPRACPAALWESLVGPLPPEGWRESDGCTCSPDAVGGMILWPACVIHDWHYSAEGPHIPRFLADLILRINIWRCLRWQGAPVALAAEVAGLYWLGVAVAGWTRWRRKLSLGDDA